GGAERWRFELAGLAALVSDLDLPPEERLAWAEGRRDRYRSEFDADDALSRQLARRFRMERAELATFLADPPASPDHPMAPGFDILAARSRRLAPLFGELIRLRSLGRLSIEIDELMGSFAHMWINRLARSDGRAHELVLFDFLARLYRTELARAEP